MSRTLAMEHVMMRGKVGGIRRVSTSFGVGNNAAKSVSRLNGGY
jgi:hypothetical protein